MADQVSAR